MTRPEELARQDIDAALSDAGWSVVDEADLDLGAAPGIAVREFRLERGIGTADYLLYVDGQACGVIEAKKKGTTLTGVEPQAQKYADGLPAHVPAKMRPLPFLTELYNVQRLVSNKLDPVAKVVITTIQRLYSMLQGQPDLDPALDVSGFSTLDDLRREPVPVAYNAALPVELFDFVFVDECHRSIYTVWRQVLEYFDTYLVGLTATPSKQTYGFFRKNLVMEYSHAEAVADAVNVDFDVYKIRTRITEHGETLDAGPTQMVGRRDRETRAMRWERLDADLSYDADALDRSVVAEDQIRTVEEHTAVLAVETGAAPGSAWDARGGGVP